MPAPREPADEAIRLAELRALAILDTEPEERFDHVTRLAQRLFGVPVALVSLVDVDRTWFKSHAGIDLTESPRDLSFCGYAILDDEVLNVPDTSVDKRFSDNPLVLMEPGIRFYAGCPISGPGGAKLGTLCLFDDQPHEGDDTDVASLRDLAAIVEQEIAALRLATVDELTGLSNKRGFNLLASKVLEVCRRRSVPARLLYLDLDGFKAVNDLFGHAEGDRMLTEFARILESALRESDIIARLGGDEFAVLLTGSQDADDDAVNRIQQAIQESNQTKTGSRQLAASIGAGVFDPAGADSLEELMERADEAMYAAKLAARQARPAGQAEQAGQAGPEENREPG